MPAAKKTKRPNFVIFLTDDQGYGDLSCMGATDFKTPHIDALAAGGARFTNWYSNSPVCSPSRAALLSGRYPGNAGVRAILAGHRTTPGLHPSIPTIATALKPLGYRTALFGKWHLGLAKGSRPEEHGFDTTFGFMAGCVDYYSHISYWGMNRPITVNGEQKLSNPLHDLWENGEEIWEDGKYLTDLIAEKAVAWVREATKSGEPFFLYLPFNAPHYPMHAPQKYKDRFPDLPWDRQIMAAMISAVDDAVGAVVDELVRQGVYEDTFFYYQSDNGPSREVRNWLDGTPDPYYGGTAGKLKGHKFSLYEGGIRSPGIMTWPARIPAGQVIHEVGAAMDVFPTFLQAAGGDPSQYEIDGVDVLPVVTEKAMSPHDQIFWEMNKQTAVRRGDWKLVLNGVLVEGAPPEDEVFLTNLADDMGERDNHALKRPEIVEELRGAALAWRDGIERRWEEEWKGKINGLAGHGAVQADATVNNVGPA
ncbi:MAG TPA: sulfatase-like hydrolase/transferase [Chloroflexota bacterium]|nr:sulfatase-like hydrolase/transferase [Chloroflexota bacterium]